MDMALVWVFACYVFIGIALATIGPVRRVLDEAVVELREGPSADDDSNSRIVPPWQSLSVSSCDVACDRNAVAALCVLRDEPTTRSQDAVH